VRHTERTVALLLVLVLSACGGGAAQVQPVATGEADSTEITASAAIQAAIESPDRTADDRALDEGRRPSEILTFFGIAPGQRVAELFAGGGYTAELLARVVGPSGQALVHNNAFVLDRFARAPLEARLARLGLDHVVPVERELDAPLPPDARDLDAVLYVLAYHDSVWMQTDRAAMNRAIFDALRPGGIYGIVDHSAEEGSGVRDVQTLHRIDEQTLIAEVLAAGFVLDAQSDVLRNPEDDRDWSASPSTAGERRGTSDRFVLRFIRPE
jgi:predicted methyltransferase